MRRIQSRISTGDPVFRENDRRNRERAAELAALLAAIGAGGSEEARRRHLAQGKLLVRDRIEGLLDPGSPFLELSPLAAHGVYDDDVPAAGLVTGVGPGPRPAGDDRGQRRHGRRAAPTTPSR